MTDEDWRNREKRQAYVDAVNEMLARTDRKEAPWSLVAAESKHYARVNVLETVVQRLEKGLADWGIDIPPSGTTEDGKIGGRK